MTCGGNSLTRSAMLNNADRTGILMIKKMSKVDLKAPEQDGKTFLVWASENGLDASAIVTALNKRI